MKRNIVLLVTLLFCGLFFGQNKFRDVLNSKKLTSMYRSVKESDKDEYYQQFYWLTKSEELKSFEHLKKIKPVVFLQFVKEINPAIPTKTLDKKHKMLREDLVHSLNQYITKKDTSNPIFLDNLDAFVDPEGNHYNLNVNPETVYELVPKEIYTFTSRHKKTGEDKNYYLWIDDEKYKIINTTPSEKDENFYTTLNQYLPNYKFNDLPAKITKGKRGEKDQDYYFVIPFSKDDTEVEYKTKDFKKFSLTRYKKSVGNWEAVEKK